MRFSIRYAAAGCVILIAAVLALRVWAVPEWKRYQREYPDLIEHVYGERIQIPEGIQDVGSLRIGRADRCVTCHLGMDEPLLEGSSLPNPFSPHPVMYHSLEEFGCTICHEGNGMAVTTKGAHENPSYSQKRMLPVSYTEASCGKCHKTRVVLDAWDMSEGRRLIEHYGCFGCHEIPGYKESRRAGYDLNGLGDKVNRFWLESWLRDPRDYCATSTMPSFDLSEREIEVLTDFLLSSSIAEMDEVAGEPERAGREEPRRVRIERGRKLVESMKCHSCHSFDGRGGKFGPDIGRIGIKVKRNWLLAWLRSPEEYFPATRMPKYSFPDQGIESVVDYLLTLTPASSLPREEVQLRNKPPESAPGQNIVEGKKLFIRYGCIGCHQLKGVRSRPAIGPTLERMGSKEIDKLDFGNTDIPRTRSDYIYHKLKEPHIFTDFLRMPDFHLTDLEARQITMALLSLSDDPIPEKLMVERPPKRAFRPRGEFGKVIERYQCLDCHVISETGNALGPDLTKIGSKVKPDWLAAYLVNPYPIRPLASGKMPNFGLSPGEVQTIVDYCENHLTADMVPDGLFAGIQPPRELVEEGEQLYYEEYGCHSCHVIRNQGGIYGPSLNDAGSRLRSGWVYALLRNPRALDPHSIIPDFGVPPEHAKAVTAFVTAQHDTSASVEAGFHQVGTQQQPELPEDIKGATRYQAKKGKAVYAKYCIFCHGADGKGKGPNAISLEVAPTDFTDLDTMARLSRDDLVRAIRDGGKSVGKAIQMPPYGRTLTTTQIKQVITYIRTFIPLTELFKYRKDVVMKERRALQDQASNSRSP